MIKYVLEHNKQRIEFLSLEAVSTFKISNPEWADIEPIAYTEDPPVLVVVVPEQVTLWQLRAVLAIMGLEDTITSVIQGMTEGPEKKAAWRAWEYANNIKRQSPTVTAIKAILQLTDEQVDQIFIQADNIDA